jgi:Restriction endonuclease S subunits
VISHAKNGYDPYILIDELEGKPVRMFTNDPKVPRARKEDVLLVWDGSIGKCASGMTGAVGSTMAVLSPKNGLNTKFLEYFIRRSKNLILETSTGTGLQHINKNFLKTVEISFPSDEAKQEIIADKLDSLLAKVKDAQSRLDTIPTILKHLKQSIFISASKPSNGDWKECTLAELCDFVGGGTPSRSNSKYWNGSIPWVSPKDMKRDRIADSQEHISDDGLKNSTSKMIPKGALLFVVRGMILNHTLPVAITDREVAINQDMKALIPKNKELSEYLFLACKAASMQILFYVKEATHGTRRIETDLLKDWKVLFLQKNLLRQ